MARANLLRACRILYASSREAVFGAQAWKPAHQKARAVGPRYGQLFWPGRVAWVMLQHYRGRPEELHFARAISLAADGFARQDKPNLALSEPPIVPLVAQRGLIACGGCFVVG